MACCITLCSCTVSPPKTGSGLLLDAATLPDTVKGSTALTPFEGAADTDYLDQLIVSEQLDSLIQEALAANPTVQQAWLTLQIRQSDRTRIGAAALPTLEYGLAGSKEKSQEASYSGSINVNWEADLWGRMADESSVSDKAAEQQASLLQSTRDTLTAEVMKAWISLIAQKHAITTQSTRLRILDKNKKFITDRYRNGLGNSEDLSSAQSAVSTAHASLEQLTQSFDEQQRSLLGLLGRMDRSGIEIPAQYPDVVLPLVDLPIQNLRRRPDLQTAYVAIEAASLGHSVAYKNLLPSISLRAALSDVAESPKAALLLDPVWSLLGQLTAPLYQGGRLRAAAKVAELEVHVAYQQYRQTLLEAVTEVEDALSREQSLRRRQRYIEQALANSHDSLAKYQRRYSSGLSTILELLNVEQSTYDLESQLDNLIYQRLQNRIVLGLALGLGVPTK